MTFTVREWTEAYTEQLQEWFQLDGDLWRYVGFSQPPTVGDLHTHVVNRMWQELGGSAKLRAIVDEHDDLVAYVTLYPHLPTHSVCHIIIAPWMRGHGVAIGKCALEGCKALGVTTVLAPTMPLVDPRVHTRWLRRVGFDIKYYGEWHG